MASSLSVSSMTVNFNFIKLSLVRFSSVTSARIPVVSPSAVASGAADVPVGAVEVVVEVDVAEEVVGGDVDVVAVVGVGVTATGAAPDVEVACPGLDVASAVFPPARSS